MPTRSERDMRFMFDSFGNLSAALQKMKREKMAKELLGEDYETYKLRTSVEDNDLDRRLKKAQIDKALRGPETDPYKQLNYDLKKRNIESLIKERGTDKTRPTFEKLDKEIEAATGYPLGKWRQAPNQRVDPKTGDFMADVAVDEMGQPKTVVVPKNLYERFLSQVKTLDAGDGEPNATPYAEQVRPDVTDAPSPKPLDPQTAKAILAEAGGDKEKAREIARQRGYTF